MPTASLPKNTRAFPAGFREVYTEPGEAKSRVTVVIEPGGSAEVSEAYAEHLDRNWPKTFTIKK